MIDELVCGLDDTIERRRGPKIKAKGIYRDPVGSSHSHFVKASSLRWLCAMLLVEVSWAGAVWGLPFLAVLCPSERYDEQLGRSHQKLTEQAAQVFKLVARWLPDRVRLYPFLQRASGIVRKFFVFNNANFQTAILRREVQKLRR